MAGKVTITKAQREALVRAGEVLADRGKESKLDAKHATQVAALLGKLDAAELPKPKGLSPRDIIFAANAGLGKRLVLPPPGAGPLWGQIIRRVTQLGLTAEQIEEVARAAATRWQGGVKLWSLVNQADALLAPEQEHPQGQAPTASGVGASGFTASWEEL